MLSSFYRAVLPATGAYCLFIAPTKSHTWVDTLEALEQRVAQLGDKQGVYFGTASFSTKESRKQANVLALKALRLDIDAGAKKFASNPDGAYETQRDALVASVAFFKAANLAPSFIVSSGEGLHIYFCLDTAVSPDVWAPMAEALGRSTVAHGLKADPTVTTDTARVLRPPGTLHPNGKRVEVLKETGKLYTVDELRSKLGTLPVTSKFDTSINVDVALTFEGPPSSALKVVEHCGALHEVAAAKGDAPEPYWRAMLGIVKHTVEGEDLAQEWSAGYDGYDERETARKLAAWSTGPTTCAEFGKHSKKCADCQYAGKIKSPIVLGRMTAPEIEKLPEDKKPEPLKEPAPTGAPWDGFMPKGFAVAKGGDRYLLKYLMETERENVNGDTVPVRAEVALSHEVFWFAHWGDAEFSSDTAMICVHKWDEDANEVRAFDISAGLLATRSDLAKKLGEHGVQIIPDKRAVTAMEIYTKEQFQRIKNISRRLRVSDRFGMRILPGGQLSSLHGKYLILPDGRVQEAMIGAALRSTAEWYPLPLPPSFNGEWGPEVWDEHIVPMAKQHVDFMRKHYSADGMAKYQLAFMLGLASPLMAFVTGGYTSGTALPPNGLSVSLFEREGGKGKTTLMQAVMLAYGKPEDLSKDQNGQGSTDLARIAKLSMWGTMPASFDEMGRTGEKSVSNLISSVANGSSREGATKDGGLRTGTRWALICLVSTNRSQRDMVTVSEQESAAVQYRLIELDMSNMPDFDQDARITFARDWAALKPCAGALGAVVQKMLCEIGAVEANNLVMRCVEKAQQLVNAGKEDRFQYRALGAMLALQALLKRKGLDMFDTAAMVNEFKIANENAKEYIKENTLTTNGLELLAKFLHEIRPSTVVTEDRGNIRGKAHFYARHIGGNLPNKVDGRYITSESLYYVSVDAMRTWCKEKGVRDTDILQDAKKYGVQKRVYPSREGQKWAEQFNLLSGMQESTRSSAQSVVFDTTVLSKHMRFDTGAEGNVVQFPAKDGPITEDAR